MNIGDKVKVGEHVVTVTGIVHPDTEGAYILNDGISVEYADGQKAIFYRKHVKEIHGNE